MSVLDVRGGLWPDASADPALVQPPTLLAPPTDSQPQTADFPEGRLQVLGRPAGYWAPARYRPLLFLGSGGFGHVWKALDENTGEEVAVKLIKIHDTRYATLARREVTALRALRHPGVVRVIDDGVVAEGWYVVMEYLDGTCFPAAGTWETIRGPTLRLLAILADLHHFGVIHADLKPANVFVQPDGRVVVIDFGVALGAALPTLELGGVGTRAFMDADRLAGRPCDVRGDLYSVGQMIWEALTGSVDHLPGRWSLVPLELRPAVQALLARDPACRPASAADAIRLLGGEVDTEVDLPEPLDAASLKCIFAGPDPFLHVPEDAAEILARRAEGDRARALAELRRWTQTGIAYLAGGRVHIERHALDRLADEQEDAELSRRIRAEEGATSTGISAVAQGVLERAQKYADDGLVNRAIRVLDLVLSYARQVEADEAEYEVLRRRCMLALRLETSAAINLGIVEIGRATVGASQRDGYADLERLLRAAESAILGDSVRSEALLSALSDDLDEEMDGWRMAVRVRGARARGDAEEEAVLRSMEPWSRRHEARRARWLGWLGNLRYRQGRYSEAADCHQESIKGRSSVDGRIAARRAAASALTELGRLSEARELAEAACREASMRRLPLHEARATWNLRVVSYREGQPLRPRGDLVEAASFDRASVALLGLSEAAIAWRIGEHAEAARLADRAQGAFEAIRDGASALLCRALRWAAAPTDVHEAVRLGEAALEMPIPGLALQALALARLAGAPYSELWLLEGRMFARRLQSVREDVRMEVLSRREALDELARVGPPPRLQSRWGESCTGTNTGSEHG